MSIHTPVTSSGIYFITFTCHRWIPLIDLVYGYDLVYKWFDVLSSKAHAITGYVIMPNHLHLLLYYQFNGQSLNTVVSNGKRFMAYEIIKRLNGLRQARLLSRLEADLLSSEKERGKKHKVWIDSFDVKECRNEWFLRQKLNYIHNNPCKGKWKLAPSPAEYPHSSASFYMTGKSLLYPVRDYWDFLNKENLQY